MEAENGVTEKSLMDCVVLQPGSILVEIDPDKELDGGLVLPEGAQQKMSPWRYGTVHKCGAGTRPGPNGDWASLYQPGDRVMFPGRQPLGQMFMMGDRLLTVMRDSQPLLGWTGVEAAVEPFSYVTAIPTGPKGEAFPAGDVPPDLGAANN